MLTKSVVGFSLTLKMESLSGPSFHSTAKRWLS